MSMLARFKLTVTAVSHHTVVWHSWLLNPLLLWRKGLLLTGKAWIVGIWRRQVADTRKCLLQTTCCRRSIMFCWCETVTWWFVFVCFFFSFVPGVSADHLCWESTGNGWMEVSHCLMKTCQLCDVCSFSRCAYTMSRFTRGVGGQIEWRVVILIWHTWKCSNNLLGVFHDQVWCDTDYTPPHHPPPKRAT